MKTVGAVLVASKARSKVVTTIGSAAIAFAMLASTSSAGAHNAQDLAARLAESLERSLAANPQTFQFTNVRDFNNGTGTAGGAFLVRSKNGLTGQIMSADLMPGHAYTVWWIIFNAPSKCLSTPCGMADVVPNSPAQTAIFFASGEIAAMGPGGGVLNSAFSTTSGGPPAGAAFNPTMPQSRLLTDSGFKAEVHLIIADHGVPAINTADVMGTWGWELTHGIPPAAWVRAAIFLP